MFYSRKHTSIREQLRVALFISLAIALGSVQSNACEDSIARLAQLKKLGESKKASIARIRFRPEDGRAAKISESELLQHLAQLTDFTLGKETADKALADGNVFFRNTRTGAQVDLTRFLDRVAPNDLRPMELWVQKMVEANMRTHTFKGGSYDESRKLVGKAAQVMVLTHATARAQNEVFAKYPDHSIVFLVSPLEPLQPGHLSKADLVLFSDGGESDLVTAAPTLNFAGGEVFFCQTQTLAGLIKHSKVKKKLELRVDADLSYVEQNSQRIRLRQDSYPQEVRAALLEIQHELDAFMADHGYFSDVIDPSKENPLPFAIEYQQERNRPGPSSARVLYE